MARQVSHVAGLSLGQPSRTQRPSGRRQQRLGCQRVGAAASRQHAVVDGSGRVGGQLLRAGRQGWGWEPDATLLESSHSNPMWCFEPASGGSSSRACSHSSPACLESDCLGKRGKVAASLAQQVLWRAVLLDEGRQL